MRSPAFLCLIFSAMTVWAQDQERSLIDRLLRPNMDLQNREESKAFHADSKVTAQHHTANMFVLKSRPKEKTLVDFRQAEMKEYRSRSDRADALQQAYLQNRQANMQGQLTTSSTRDVRPVYDRNLQIPDRRYADERSFRDQGKSQKSLNQQNPPLTIDQVRALLNKNK